MPIFFGNKNKLVPSKTDLENGLQPLDSITGDLVSVNVRPGNSSSGFWTIFKIKKDYGYSDVFFDAVSVGETELNRYNSLRGKTVTISSDKENPSIETVGESEETLRASLLKGVASGNIPMDDLPVLLEVAKGKDVPFEKWDLFKRQVENEGLADIKEKMDMEAMSVQEEIEMKKAEIRRLEETRQTIMEERDRMLNEMGEALMVLQGEGDSVLHGTQFTAPIGTGNGHKNLIRIGNNYNELVTAFKEFKTKKGVYVVCGDNIFAIDYAYVEDKGRAFLIGSSREYKKTKPEEVKTLIDKRIKLAYGFDVF